MTIKLLDDHQSLRLHALQDTVENDVMHCKLALGRTQFIENIDHAINEIGTRRNVEGGQNG